MHNVREEVKKLIQEIMHIDIDTVDNEKNIATIDEWDSFNNLMLISKVEDHFKLKFSMKDVESATTIKKIIQLIEQKRT